MGNEVEVERVRVKWRRDGDIAPALRQGDVIAWDYVSRGDHSSGVERSFLLIELGVKLTIPYLWRERGDPDWYVDLAIVSRAADLYTVIDLDIDVVVPVDGRPYRMVDLDEFADAIEAGEFTMAEAMDGMRRCQRFLDTHLHRYGPGDVQAGLKDFPPAAIRPLANLPEGALRA